MFRVPPPEFVTVMVFGPLVEPWVVAGKVMEPGESVMAGVEFPELPQPTARSRRKNTPREDERLAKS